ncbi:MAG: hypothetical protein D6714_02095 [Bacteroidetes bacterium]|nr:MAG: hypothetical protein D6714_02095 [Bacteroidota bacterium]
MNIESFAGYIRNPSRLFQINYQELKSLVLQYPYCQNLRYLLLLKSKMENHRDFQRNLEMAAMYGIDRNFLFHLMRQMEPETQRHDSFSIEGEVLELKDLNHLESELEWAETDTGEAEKPALSFSLKPDNAPVFEPDFGESGEDDDEDFLEDLLADDDDLGNFASARPEDPSETPGFSQTIDELAPPAETPDRTADPEVPTPEAIEEVIEIIPKENVVTPDLIQNLVCFSEVLDWLAQKDAPATAQLSSETDMPAPEPKTTFRSWLEQFEADIPEKRLDEILEISKKAKEARKARSGKSPKAEPQKAVPGKKAKTTAKKAAQLAKESVREDDDIVSELLARILERQGHLQKAIDMYERLSLENPEKSSFFAAKIEELRSRLKD